MNSNDLKRNFLVAYPYVNEVVIKALKKRESEIRFVLDSGAFTAWKAGKAIVLDDYCKFLEKLPITPWRYFTLDVIGEPDASIKNYEIMLKRGFKPVPIFTRGEKPEMIEEYYKTSDLVGIGGLVGTQGNKGFVNGIMKQVAGRKVHWLGFTSIDYIKYYKPYMCDSSSFTSAVRYGRLGLYEGNGKFKVVNQKTFLEKPSKEIFALLHKHDIPLEDLGKSYHWVNSPGYRAFVTASYRAWAMFQHDITTKIGCHFFLACNDANQIDNFYNAFDWMEAKK
jgi:hypothetical protein